MVSYSYFGVPTMPYDRMFNPSFTPGTQEDPRQMEFEFTSKKIVCMKDSADNNPEDALQRILNKAKRHL